MPKGLRWKFILMAALIVFAAVLLMPSFYSNTPQWFKKYVYQEGLKLGLDLQGGMHLILKVDVDQAVRNAADLAARDLQDALKHKHITIVRRKSPSNDVIVFAVPNRNAVEQIKNILSEDYPNLELKEVRENGKFPLLVLRLAAEEEKFIRENAVDQSLEIIRNRIDQFGVSEPVIVRQGEDEIVVQLPGVKDPKRALKLIGQTAQLEFKLVDSDSGVNIASLIRKAVDDGRLPAGADVKVINSVLKGQIPRGDAVYFMKEADSRTGRIKNAKELIRPGQLIGPICRFGIDVDCDIQFPFGEERLIFIFVKPLTGPGRYLYVGSVVVFKLHRRNTVRLFHVGKNAVE